MRLNIERAIIAVSILIFLELILRMEVLCLDLCLD
jgi:hypothetical protein